MNVDTAAYLRAIIRTDLQLQCWRFMTSTAITRPDPPFSTTNSFRLFYSFELPIPTTFIIAHIFLAKLIA